MPFTRVGPSHGSRASGGAYAATQDVRSSFSLADIRTFALVIRSFTISGELLNISLFYGGQPTVHGLLAQETTDAADFLSFSVRLKLYLYTPMLS